MLKIIKRLNWLKKGWLKLINKNLETMVNKIIENKNRCGKRGQLTTTIDYELLEDYKESMKLLNKPMSAVFDSMLRLIYNNEDFFNAFIKEMESM